MTKMPKTTKKDPKAPKMTKNGPIDPNDPNEFQKLAAGSILVTALPQPLSPPSLPTILTTDS
jgi:hypothetical protein